MTEQAARQASLGRVRRFGLRLALRIAAVLAALGLLLLGLVLAGSGLPAPLWAVAQLEQRLNAEVQRSLPGMGLALEGITLSVSRDFSPRVEIAGLSLLNASGAPVLALPKVQATVPPWALMAGNLHLRELAIKGANLQVTRDLQGRLDIAFSSGAAMDLAQIFALSDRFFGSPLGRDMRGISISDLTLSLTDQRLARTWGLGNGTLTITHRDGEIAAGIGLTLLGTSQGGDLGRVDLSLISAKGSQEARITARLTDISARDLAAQAAPLAFMSVLDAPISGNISTTLTPNGITQMQAQVQIGAGALAPDPAAAPVVFQSAQIDLDYDPAQGRVRLNDVQVMSETLTLKGAGHGDVLRADGSVIKGALAGEVPAAFIIQLQMQSLRLARPELFTAPVTFTAGAADLRLRLAPFSVDIGQIALTDGDTRIAAKGQVSAGAQGWQSSIDASVNQISAAKLLGLWPKNLKRGTRDWLDRNLLAGRFSDLRLALRQMVGDAPKIDLGYRFDGLTVTPMRSLPAITGGVGYGAITGRAFTMVLEKGRATPPLGGDLDMAGSVFSIPDITKFPATGKLDLRSVGAVTATLSLLDQKPFQFIQKSGRTVDFAGGTARLLSHIELPLQKIITLPDVRFQVTGQITNFRTSKLVPSRTITAPRLDVFVDSAGLRIAGQGDIAGVGFDGAYSQQFGPQNAGKSRVTGTADLSDTALSAFGVALPKGMITGAGRAEVALDITRGQAAKMVLTSDLNRIRIAIPPVGFEKPTAQTGSLRAEITLSSPPVVTKLALKAGDLQAEGRVTVAKTGGLERADFADISLGKWFAGDVSFVGVAGNVAMQVGNASVDMRYFPTARGSFAGNSAASAMPITLRLDRLRVSDGITLTGFQGDFTAAKGLSGNFAAQIDGGVPIQGQLAPAALGTAIRVTAQDAGRALAEAGVYGAAKDGALDLVLTPRARAGSYDGEVQMTGVRVQSSSVLAELLNAISVVGLIDQLGGSGILFNAIVGKFTLTPEGVDLREGAATGGSLGVTMQGVYRFAGAQLDMQGVVSPVYILNGIGAAISRRGEGVLGFNYTLRGTADDPIVGVNPLSVLMPGFFRDMFKAPKATLESPP